jgi:hypothetical protein
MKATMASRLLDRIAIGLSVPLGIHAAATEDFTTVSSGLEVIAAGA